MLFFGIDFEIPLLPIWTGHFGITFADFSLQMGSLFGSIFADVADLACQKRAEIDASKMKTSGRLFGRGGLSDYADSAKLCSCSPHPCGGGGRDWIAAPLCRICMVRQPSPLPPAAGRPRSLPKLIKCWAPISVPLFSCNICKNGAQRDGLWRPNSARAKMIHIQATI